MGFPNHCVKYGDGSFQQETLGFSLESQFRHLLFIFSYFHREFLSIFFRWHQGAVQLAMWKGWGYAMTGETWATFFQKASHCAHPSPVSVRSPASLPPSLSTTHLHKVPSQSPKWLCQSFNPTYFLETLSIIHSQRFSQYRSSGFVPPAQPGLLLRLLASR